MPKPNLLFIFADQMRACDWRGGLLHTPNLDRLARDGARFENTFANCPVCTPSRAVLLTGLLPPRNRVVTNDLPLPENVQAIGDFLGAAGYRTGYVGKWHLDGVPRGKFTPPGPRRHGFDFWAAFNCTHDYAHPKYFRDTPQLIETPGYEPEVQTDVALEFLRENRNDPFALFLSWGPPHDPYPLVPAEFRALYDADALPLRPNVEPCGNALARNLECRETLANYYAAISALDFQLGRLLAALDENGLAENTFVIFTSDHGDMLWSHGRMKKQLPHEESIGVPFVLRGPGVPAGSAPENLLSIADFTPSLLGLLNIESDLNFDGTDLSPAMRGENCASPDAVLLLEMAPADEALPQNIGAWRGLRTKTHTYARHADGTPWLLFDNAADPFQLINLVGDAAHGCLQDDLDELLSLRLRQACDPMLPWDETLRAMNLVAEWNAREAELHPADGRFLR